MVGLSSDKSIDGLALYYYGTMEFIALQTHQIIEKMNESGHSISSIFMSGSQCQNDILMNLMASACGIPVIIPRYVHAAAKAASADKEGKTEDLWSIMDRMSKPGKIVEPSTDKHELALFQAKYKVFLEQCESQMRFRNEVDAAIENWGKPQEKAVDVSSE